jgi:hypothetical protein
MKSQTDKLTEDVTGDLKYEAIRKQALKIEDFYDTPRTIDDRHFSQN